MTVRESFFFFDVEFFGKKAKRKNLTVVTAGCVPVWIAYCSAGSPNASQPIG